MHITPAGVTTIAVTHMISLTYQVAPADPMYRLLQSRDLFLIFVFDEVMI